MTDAPHAIVQPHPSIAMPPQGRVVAGAYEISLHPLGETRGRIHQVVASGPASVAQVCRIKCTCDIATLENRCLRQGCV
jgi:hypothetical protein